MLNHIRKLSHVQREAASVAGELGPPPRHEVEAAVRLLIRWVGDDPTRQGVLDTPARFVRAWEEWFAGYRDDPVQLLTQGLEQGAPSEEMVLLRDVVFHSHCEHHIAPITGKAHLAYIPAARTASPDSLISVVECYARRLQIQEKMTAQIAESMWNVLSPRGVAVMIEATHACMSTRGVQTAGVLTVTNQMLGSFRDSQAKHAEFLTSIGRPTDPKPLADGVFRAPLD